jgi:hypothetical protein
MVNKNVFVVLLVISECCVCLQLGEALLASLTMTGKSPYNCAACKALCPRSIDKTQAQVQESLPNEGGAVSSASSNEEVSSLISVRNQLEAVCLNGQCTIELIESLVDIVSSLTKEVTHLKQDNALPKQEIRNLHKFIEASPRLPPKYIAKEQRILPMEVSQKDATSIEHVPTAALSTEALPAALIPATAALTELLYSDVAVAGISPSGSVLLPDCDGFKTVMYRKKAATITPPAEIPAMRKVRHGREPCIGVSSSLSLPVIRKPERTKMVFVSRFSPKLLLMFLKH